VTLKLTQAGPIFLGPRATFIHLYIHRQATNNLHVYLNEELHNLYNSTNIIRTIKSRRKRWVRHVEHMEEMRNAYKNLVGKPEGKSPQRRPCIDRKIISEWNLQK
jgi:hypothetical protein